MPKPHVVHDQSAPQVPTHIMCSTYVKLTSVLWINFQLNSLKILLHIYFPGRLPLAKRPVSHLRSAPRSVSRSWLQCLFENISYLQCIELSLLAGIAGG